MFSETWSAIAVWQLSTFATAKPAFQDSPPFFAVEGGFSKARKPPPILHS
jgi:hypothetical protein